MSAIRCQPHDLPLDSCADCSPRSGTVTAGALLPDERGPWFLAAYHGTCTGCGEDITPDDEIRADGQGGWERRECCGDDTEPAAATGTSETQASALAAFWDDDHQAPRVLRDVRLVSWGPDPGHPGYPNLTQPPDRRSP